MTSFLLRVALPDRPGALGAVASRIGAVRADVVAVDVVGRADGRAVDEFVVQIADERHVSLLMSEIAEVDGVDVEEIRILPDRLMDRRLDAYQVARALLEQRTTDSVLAVAAVAARRQMGSTWSVVLDASERHVLASDGRPPAASWLAAYVTGTRWHGPTRTLTEVGPDHLAGIPGGAATPPVHAPASDVAWVTLQMWDLVLVVGRPGAGFGERERTELAALAALVDARWSDVAQGQARALHPSRVS